MVALDRCSLEVNAGEVFGLLGPNGAGKTTLLRLLMGFLRPTSGSATIDGLDCFRERVRVHERVCYLPGDARLFRGMRGRDVLKFFGRIRADGNAEKATQLAERLELDLSRLVAFMSTGMRQKLALASMLATDSPLLILDEPTANLDPTVRNVVLELVAEARTNGRTVIFSSHVLSEVEEVCDRVVILRKGELVLTQVMSDLRRRHRVWAKLTGPLPTTSLPDSNDATITERGDNVIIECRAELTTLLPWLSSLPLEDMRIEPVGLRSVYDLFHTSDKSSKKSAELETTQV